jgi:phospholipid/cholesterol/gamma-HCH transport system substrate-binding protein
MGERVERTELVVGAFVASGLALLGVLVLLFGNVRDLFRGHYGLEVVFPSAGELTARSHVRLGGARVGRVAGAPELNPTFDSVTVPLRVYRQEAIPEGSSFRIAASGLMGDAYIEITPPAELSGGRIAPGSTVQGSGVGGLSGLTAAADTLTDEAQETMRDLRGAIAKLDTALDAVNAGVLSPENLDGVASAIDRLDSSLQKLDVDFFTATNATALETTLANLAEAADEIREGAKRIGPVLESAEAAVGRAGPAIDQVAEAAAGIEAAAGDISEVAGGITGGDGALAALLNDPALRDDLAALIRNLRRHGPLFYRDSADPHGEEPGPESGDGGRPRARRPAASPRR